MGEKKIRGRKRHILVDTEGNLLAVCVLPADLEDVDGAVELLHDHHRFFGDIEHIWADMKYRGEFVSFCHEHHNITVEVVSRAPEQEGFVVLPRRWVVERTIAWFGRYRGLSKDYEHDPIYSESMIYLASLHILLKKLRPDETASKPYKSKQSKQQSQKCAKGES